MQQLAEMPKHVRVSSYEKLSYLLPGEELACGPSDAISAPQDKARKTCIIGTSNRVEAGIHCNLGGER